MIKAKSLLSKANFWLGRNPKIENTDDYRKFIPEPYSSVLLITADFELAWAWRYAKSNGNILQVALEKARQERENISLILHYCKLYNIPITWATVGHLFLSACKNKNGLAHENLPRLKNFENNYWTFKGNDWFEHDPCTNLYTDPEWYGQDLIKKILASKTEHEIGCHTFSHIDCRDSVCNEEVFNEEINECQKEAMKYGLTLKSFVHPAHTIGNIRSLSKLGFTSYQSDPGNILGYPVYHGKKLWEIKRSYEFTYRNDWSLKYHIYRYKKIIDRAVESNTICSFWFHPSISPIFVNHVMPEIFNYIREKRSIWYTTVHQYIQWLNNTHDE